MLNEFRSTYITWDKATRRIYSPITANESDENGRKLVVQIVNGGQVEDLTGATLHLYWETRDKAHDGLDVFDAVDLKKGEFELSYTTGMLSNQGVLNANFVLIDTVGRVVSERFKITVTEGIDDDAIQSENSFSSLTQALIDISNLEQNYAPRLNDLTAQLQQTEQELSSHLAENASTTKKGHVQLSNALNSVSESLAATPKAVSDLLAKVDLFTSGKAEVRVTDGRGAALCPNDQSIYFLYAQDKGNKNAYLIATGVRHSGSYPDGLPQFTVIHQNILGLGASNSQGTQVIVGAVTESVVCYCIGVPYIKYGL